MITFLFTGKENRQQFLGFFFAHKKKNCTHKTGTGFFIFFFLRGLAKIRFEPEALAEILSNLPTRISEDPLAQLIQGNEYELATFLVITSSSFFWGGFFCFGNNVVVFHLIFLNVRFKDYMPLLPLMMI
jgi:hypothetical protein